MTAAEMALTRDELEAWFIVNACPDHHIRGGPGHVRALHTAARILAQHPELARDSLCTAVVAGNLAEVRRILDERPAAANEGCGPKGATPREQELPVPDPTPGAEPRWTPLLYLCFTRLATPDASQNAVAIARELLDRGADPNVHFMAGDSRYTPLVGVAGEGEENRGPHPQRDALARLLLERGAEPYDIQVLYDIHFRGELRWFLELVHEFSLARGRAKDWQDPEWSMLDMGGYGCGARYVLGIAVDRNDLALAEWCLERGASADAPPPKGTPWWQPSRRSLHEEAVLRGHAEMAQLLERHGAKPGSGTLDGDEALLAAAMRGDFEEARALARRAPERARAPALMHQAARRDRADVVALLLELGASVDSLNGDGETALHAAAYADSTAVLELLLARGAQVDVFSRNHGGTALWYALYGQRKRACALLARVSRDVWSLTHLGELERLREVLAREPALANAGAKQGDVPLLYLAGDEDTCLEIARLLLAHGADPLVRQPEHGWNAIELAERRCLPRVAAALRAKRA